MIVHIKYNTIYKKHMLTKESIVAHLLDAKLITTAEAVVLLKVEDFNGIRFVPIITENKWVGPGPSNPPYTTPITKPMFPYCVSTSTDTCVSTSTDTTQFSITTS